MPLSLYSNLLKTKSELGQSHPSHSVTIRLFGGLGNQMFQYAFARAQEKETGAQIYFDTESGFRKDPYNRKPILARLHITSKNANLRLNRLARYAASKNIPLKWVGFLHNICPPQGMRIYCETRLFNYDPFVFVHEHGHRYFSGYWQNPRYFENCGPELRHDFASNLALNEYGEWILNQIRNTEAVALHVRKYDRADKMLFKKLRTSHVTLPDSYYQQAIEIINRRINGQTYFIFSDDPEVDLSFLETRKHYLRVDSSRVGDDLVEHWLMSQCKHQIIANSTFSWWGAWLNKNPEKIVVAPRTWFNTPLESWKIIPQDWLSVS